MSDTPITDEIAEQANRNVLLVLTGPSGAGKDSVFAKLLEKHPDATKIVTTTSRKPREGERDGDPYYFVSRDEFEQLIADGAFFEWVEFRGELYGTQKRTLDEALRKSSDVIWRIEAKGVKNIKEKIRAVVPRSVFVFITAPEVALLKQRVYNAEGEEKATLRWNEPLVVWEMKQYRDCEYLVVNEDGELNTAVTQIEAIMTARRLELFAD